MTAGQFSLQQVHVANGYTEELVLQVAASLESRSEHPISKAFAHDNLLSVSEFEVTAGGGISGVVSGQKWHMGSASFTGVSPNSIAPNANVFLTTGDYCVAAFLVSDSLHSATAPSRRLTSRTLSLQPICRCFQPRYGHSTLFYYFHFWGNAH